MADELMFVRNTLWTGFAGKQLRAYGVPAQLLGLYFFTCNHTTPLGCFYLPMRYMIYDIGTLDEALILKLLRYFRDIDFAYYDLDNECVWIVDMARYQILGSGKNMKPYLDLRDHKVKWCRRLYGSIPQCAHLGPFFDRYARPFHLVTRREGAGTLVAGNNAASQDAPEIGTESEGTGVLNKSRDSTLVSTHLGGGFEGVDKADESRSALARSRASARDTCRRRLEASRCGGAPADARAGEDLKPKPNPEVKTLRASPVNFRRFAPQGNFELFDGEPNESVGTQLAFLPQPLEPNTNLWTVAKGWLGSDKHFGKLMRDFGEDWLKDAILQTMAREPNDPKTYLLGVLNGTNIRTGNRRRQKSAAERATESAAEALARRRREPR